MFRFLKMGLTLPNAYLLEPIICCTHSKHIQIALCSISDPSQASEDFEIRHFGEFEYEYSDTVWKFWKIQDRQTQQTLYFMDLHNNGTDTSMDSTILYDNMWVSVLPIYLILTQPSSYSWLAAFILYLICLLHHHLIHFEFSLKSRDPFPMTKQ